MVYKSEKGFPNLKIKIKSHLSDFGALGTLKPLPFVGDTVVCHPDFPSEKGLLSQLLAVLLAGNRQLSAPLWLPQLQRTIWPNISPLTRWPTSNDRPISAKVKRPSHLGPTWNNSERPFWFQSSLWGQSWRLLNLTYISTSLSSQALLPSPIAPRELPNKYFAC